MIHVTKKSEYTIVVDESIVKAIVKLLNKMSWAEMAKHITGIEANLLEELRQNLEEADV